MLSVCAIRPVVAQPFERQVAPLPVRDADGVPYAYPFLGGFNAPRLQFVDIDADGDPDLFVQDDADAVMFFENTGSPAAPQFTWRTDRYRDLAVGEWFRFGDLDRDGDADLLAEQPFSHIRYYRNDGTPQQPRFTLAADTLYGFYTPGAQAVRDTALVIDRQNVPALADLDCDGWPDLFVATVEAGTLIFYRGHAPAGGLPRFEFVTDRYQDIEIIGGLGKDGFDRVQHGANAVTFVDLDADGDPDLIWGDFFSPSLYVIENRGRCGAPALERTADVFPPTDPLQTSGYNAPQFADIDADGDADLFVGVLGGAFSASRNLADNFYFFENAGGAFHLRTTRYLSMIDLGDESVPAAGDVDGDGAVDLVVGNKLDPLDPQAAQLIWFRNEGRPGAPAFRRAAAPLAGFDGFNAAPALADLDADGDADLLVGGFNGRVAFYRNEGAGVFTLVDPALVSIRDPGLGIQGSHSTPAVGDLDGDGDADLLVGEASGALNFFRNDGTAAAPRFSFVTDAYQGILPGSRSAPVLHDLDRDGDLDLFVGTERGGLVSYRNDGTAAAAVFVPAAPVLGEPAAGFVAPAFADLDADGDADLVAGTAGGGLLYFASGRVVTGAGPRAPDAPVRLTVYPDPFRTSATFRVALSAPVHARLRVYDVLGREVRVLLDGSLSAGPHAIPFSGAGLPAGLYVYVLTADGRPVQHGTVIHVD